jgi:hypothetical protein
MTALVMQAAKGRLYGSGLAHVARVGGQCRAVWNLFLAKNKLRYQDERKFISFAEMSAQLPRLRKEDPRLAGLPSRCAQMTVKRLDRALKACGWRWSALEKAHFTDLSSARSREDPNLDPEFLAACRALRRQAPRHSITRSARASSDSGTTRPSAFATLRLITSSTLFGCCTGRSAGFAPASIFPTYTPSRRHVS